MSVVVVHPHEELLQDLCRPLSPGRPREGGKVKGELFQTGPILHPLIDSGGEIM